MTDTDLMSDEAEAYLRRGQHRTKAHQFDEAISCECMRGIGHSGLIGRGFWAGLTDHDQRGWGARLSGGAGVPAGPGGTGGTGGPCGARGVTRAALAAGCWPGRAGCRVLAGPHRPWVSGWWRGVRFPAFATARPVSGTPARARAWHTTPPRQKGPGWSPLYRHHGTPGRGLASRHLVARSRTGAR